MAPIIPAVMITASFSSFAKISDLPNYYASARMAVERHGDGIYNFDAIGAEEKVLFPAIGSRVVRLYVPPPALPWLLPLACFSRQAVPAVWVSALIAAFAASLFLLKPLFQLSWTEILAVWAVAVVSGPLYEAIRIGQLSSLLLLSFCLTLWALKAKRSLLAGLAMSFFLLKPQEMLPFVAYLLGGRRWKPVACMLVIACLLAVVSFCVIGPDGYRNYLHLMLSAFGNTQGMQPELSPTLRGQLLRFFPEQKLAVIALSSVVSAAVLVVNWLLGRSFKRHRQWLEVGVAAAVPIGVVSALYCHDYDLLLLIPSVVACLKLGLCARLPEPVKLAVILTATILLLPVYKWVHYDYLLSGGACNPIFWYLAGLSVSMVLLVNRCRLELLLDDRANA